MQERIKKMIVVLIVTISVILTTRTISNAVEYYVIDSEYIKYMFQEKDNMVGKNIGLIGKERRRSTFARE